MKAAARLIAGAGALIGAYGLYLQFILLYDDMTAHGSTTMEAMWRYLAYFTIVTNLFVTLVLARAALSPLRLTGLNAPRMELMAVTSILFVGVVYNLLLASRWNPQGWQKIADVIVHDAMPITFALFWLLRPHGSLKWRDALFAAIWPFAYAVYGLTRGVFDHFYPYFFIDPTVASWPQILLNLIGLVIAFMIGATLLIALSRTFGRRTAS